MKRKLFSVPLCAFALLLLMGASAVPQQTALLAEEESAVLDETALETEAQVSTGIQESDEESDGAAADAAGQSDLEENQAADGVQAENVDQQFRVDGAPVSAKLGKFQQDGVTYVALAPMAQVLDSSVQIGWDGSKVEIYSSHLALTARVGEQYLVANGRYLYLPDGVRMVDGMVTVPLWAVAKAFDAAVGWDAASGTVLVTRGSGAIQPGDSFYDQEELFWLSRVISAESGNQPLEGKMAVGNVVMNRVASPIYPNTVEGVLAQKNQFSTYKSGALANRTPSESCVIAAKLVLDGGVVEETKGALYFDSSTRSWAAKNREFITTLGGHKFYY